MKILNDQTIISVSGNKILSEITVKRKRYKIMQKKEGAVEPTDSFEIGTIFDKSMVKFTTVPSYKTTGEEIVNFKERTVFYVEV